MATTTLSEVTVTGSRSIDANVVASNLGINSIQNPDDYYLEKVELITSVGRVNLKGLMVEISYYEDIFRGTITGNILINDSISLINRVSLSGYETLLFSFKKSKDAEFKVDKKFKIFRIGERMLKTNSSEVYSLHFCSEELFLSEQIKISKSYSGKKINEIVTDILLNEMKIDTKLSKKEILVENTKGVYDFLIPYKKPFEAINWLANYAQSTRNTGSDFVFFENIDGLNFNSLQTLYSQPLYRTFVYQLRTATDSKVAGELGTALNGIKSYNFLDTFDTLYGTNKGVFANKLITIDTLTRRYYNTNFDYESYFSRSKTLNGSPIITDFKNSLGKKLNENYEAVLKVLTTNRNQESASYISEKQGSVAKDVFVESYVSNRTAQLSLAHYSRLKIAVSGDPFLKVGDVISIILPAMISPENNSAQGGIDEYHSGKYLITSARHIIDVNLKYETILEIAKESLSKTLPPVSTIETKSGDVNSNPSAPISGGRRGM